MMRARQVWTWRLLAALVGAVLLVSAGPALAAPAGPPHPHGRASSFHRLDHGSGHGHDGVHHMPAKHRHRDRHHPAQRHALAAHKQHRGTPDKRRRTVPTQAAPTHQPLSAVQAAVPTEAPNTKPAVVPSSVAPAAIPAAVQPVARGPAEAVATPVPAPLTSAPRPDSRVTAPPQSGSPLPSHRSTPATVDRPVRAFAGSNDPIAVGTGTAVLLLAMLVITGLGVAVIVLGAGYRGRRS